jgi:hypothetical protein
MYSGACLLWILHDEDTGEGEGGRVTSRVGGSPGVVRAGRPAGCYLTLIAVQAFATAVYSTLPAP